MQTSPRFYLPELDGLRFIAFLLVFIHNAPSISSSKAWTLLHEYGWIGVDLFFCLSGFLITKLLMTEHEQTGTINIRNFYTRRVLRIWPLYFFYIILIFLFPTLFQRNYTDRELLQVAGLITFTFNFTYIHIFPYATTFFIHLWTISFEEQFYLFAPWLIRGIPKIRLKMGMGFLAVIFLAGTALRAFFIYSQVEHPAIYVLPFTRFEAMLGGVVIGLGLFDNILEKIQTWVLLLLGTTFNAIVFFLPNVYETNWSLMASYLCVGIGMSLITFTVTRQKNQVLKILLSNPLFVYLGRISYGLYIFHIISVGFAFKFTNTNNRNVGELNVFVFFAGLIITIILSTLSYKVMEKPFLKLKEKFGLVPSRPV